jgi:hypothetical protein
MPGHIMPKFLTLNIRILGIYAEMRAEMQFKRGAKENFGKPGLMIYLEQFN